MRKILTYIILLSSSYSFGQEMIGRIDPSVILEQKIISCTEWHSEEKGMTVFFNSKGLPHYFHFPADVLDTNSNLIHGDYGKREFKYDENGNLIESIMSCYEPTLDSSVVMTLIKSYYKENLIVKREYYDNPSANPTEITYIYDNKLLSEERKTHADSSLIVNTGEKFKLESTAYRYDNSQSLTTVLNFRESRLLDSTTVTYHGNTKTWTTFDSSNQVTSIVKSVYDSLNREVERIYPEKRNVKWYYKENGLLDSIEYTSVERGEIRRTSFTYEK